MNAWLAIGIFFGAYVLIATEKIHKTIVAVTGASLMIMLGLVSFEQATESVDLNVIFLLVGMMTSVHILSKTGFFEWTAISVAKYAKGDPLKILVLLLTVTAVLSAFLDNVTTIVLLAPVTILIMQLLELSPVPVLILEALASNIGGTGTLIGDPPNIVIGSQARLSFVDFLVHLGPIVLIIFAVFVLTVVMLFSRRMSVSETIKARVNDAIPHLAIVDRKNMIRSLSVFALMFLGFFCHSVIHVEAGVISLLGGMVMMIVCHSESDETLMTVEWGVIFFFIGMFMMIAGLEANGVISWIGHALIKAAGHDLFMICLIILWGSAVFSSIFDNIPFVIVMIPLIEQIAEHFSGPVVLGAASQVQGNTAQPLWWALALGACLGGNGTIIGASANIVMSRISERNKHPVSFFAFFRYGFPFMVQTMIIATVYLWLRYF